MTFALLLSSLTMTLATRAAVTAGAAGLAGRRRWRSASRFWRARRSSTRHLLGGAAPMGLTADLFASTFYVVTGFHALHVLAGVVGIELHVSREGEGASD